MVLSTTGILIYLPFKMYYKSAFIVACIKTTLFANILTQKCTLGHENLGVCEVSDAYLLGCFRYREKHVKYAVSVCCCSQICNQLKTW